MVTALTLLMAAQIVSIPEALEGFANSGLLTVVVLFVVAEGMAKTGALDWYMNKLLLGGGGNNNNNNNNHNKMTAGGGTTTTATVAAAAQLRLMIPVAVVAGFLNNAPIVTVMIPMVQRWAQQIRVPVQQLLIPLSLAAIWGGTCTLIGTSTNLVVVGLLHNRYPDDPEIEKIGMFDLGKFGVPVAMVGCEYLLLLIYYVW